MQTKKNTKSQFTQNKKYANTQLETFNPQFSNVICSKWVQNDDGKPTNKKDESTENTLKPNWKSDNQKYH